MVSLPEELLQQICGEVSRMEGGNAALFNIMRSSKIFYHLARPILYHTLDIDKIRYDFKGFLQLLSDKPETCGFVREIHFGGWCAHALPEPDSDMGQSLQVLTKADSMSPALRAHVEAGLLLLDTDALLALLLCVCERLMVLELNPNQLDEGGPTSRFVNEVAIQGAGNSLKHLNILQVPDGACNDTAHLYQLFPFWKLPSLTSFGGYQLEFTEYHLGTKITGSNLRQISLRQSLVDSAGLKRILILCPHLREIVVGIMMDPEFSFDAHGDLCEVAYSDIGNVLRSQGTRLESFAFYGDEEHGPRDPDGLPLGDLTCMNQLRTLCVERDAIFGEKIKARMRSPAYLTEVLPESLHMFGLRNLHLWGDDPEFLEMLDSQLVELMKCERFAKLEWIRILREEDDFNSQIPQGWRYSMSPEPGWIDPNDRLYGYWDDQVDDTWMCFERIRD